MRSISMIIALSVGGTLPSLAQNAIGVASCDNFLATYKSCVAAKLPAAQQAAVDATIKETRANWEKVAANPDGKAKLDATCKETTDKIKKEVAALNCPW